MGIINLEIPSTSSPEHIPFLWEQNDVLIFLIDLDDYSSLDEDHLDNSEKEHLEGLKTEYFKKRYIISRMVLKYILCSLLNGRSLSDISLYKDKYGRLHVRDHDDLNLCISYTENTVVLAISKIEIGIDIEVKRSLCLKSVSKYLQTKNSDDDKCSKELDNLTIWALKEAYCKFSNKSLFSALNKELDLDSICHSSYLINNKYILAIINGSSQHRINICRLEKIACGKKNQIKNELNNEGDIR